jgi:hypothetical protein
MSIELDDLKIIETYRIAGDELAKILKKVESFGDSGVIWGRNGIYISGPCSDGYFKTYRNIAILIEGSYVDKSEDTLYLALLDCNENDSESFSCEIDITNRLRNFID